jgi:glycosyltransferase involved in cell wall biosynthesis
MEQSKDLKISAVIPAFNAAQTIRLTIDSVLAQTRPADEILVIDDGSSDTTAAILDSYGPVLRVIRQENRGAASTRNRLCQEARGDLIAFLDADDRWHPAYLRTQENILRKFPQASASFLGHITFVDNFAWPDVDLDDEMRIEHISALDFLVRYNKAPGAFVPSCCCMPRAALQKLGSQPFQIPIAEDCYFYNRFPLLGSVLYSEIPLMAYRRTPGSLSSNRYRLSRDVVRVFEALEPEYIQKTDASFQRTFFQMYALKRYVFSKILLHAGEDREARIQLAKSFGMDPRWQIRARILAVLLSSFLPKSVRPDWLAKYPEWKARA